MGIFGIVSFPVYRKEDDNNLYLARAEDGGYDWPYIFWGGPYFGPGSVIGNIKLGPPLTFCPEEGHVITKCFACGKIILYRYLGNVLRYLFVQSLLQIPGVVTLW